MVFVASSSHSRSASRVINSMELKNLTAFGFGLPRARSLPASFNCFCVETEFWGQNDAPNLMVEYSAEDATDLMVATSFHVGEVKRNPYHVLMPAWMMDNVRRGAELVGGQGNSAPQFRFAQLYRLRKWSGIKLEDFY